MSKLLFTITLLPFFLSCATTKTEEKATTTNSIQFMQNTEDLQTDIYPFFQSTELVNGAIPFDKLTKERLEQFYNDAIQNADKTITEITTTKAKTFLHIVKKYDYLLSNLGFVKGVCEIIENASPNDDLRKEAAKINNLLNQKFTEISLNETLYKTLKAYSQTDEAKSFTGYKLLFITKTIEELEKNGFLLPKEKRIQLKTLFNEVSDMGEKFSRNIAEDKQFMTISIKEADGLPDDYIKSRLQKDTTKIKIDLSYPSYIPFMQNAKSDELRKKLYMMYTNRAVDSNRTLLKNILIKRKEIAKLLGYGTYAEYTLSTKMAKHPTNVWEFEQNLTNKVKDKASKDYSELLSIKKRFDTTAKTINSWETSYLSNILLKEKYNVDHEEIKKYFPLENVITGLFQVTKTLFGLEYTKVENPSVWQKNVTLYEVKDLAGILIGYFYLDLHPRQNKFTHAACFPIASAHQRKSGYKYPVAALICNFPSPTAEQPSLMPHSQVVTLFHEFGHVLHTLLNKTDLSQQSGFNVAHDFVEAPSQLFENFVWNYDVLKSFAIHYQTKEILPKDLFDKMLKSKNAGSGLSTLQQIFYGTVDMTLHDKFDPYENKNIADVIKEVQNTTLLFPYVEGTHFEASFGHLIGYAAGYYGYLWSKVFAEDMFVVFEKNDVLSKSIGMKYRSMILEPGGSMNEMEMLKNFLGREATQDAFIKSIGI